MGDSFESSLDSSFVTTLTQIIQTSDLLLTYSSVVDLEDIDRIFLLEAILVDTDDDLLTRVDTSLRTSCSFFDTHLRQTRFDSLSHTTHTFDFLDVLPCLVHEFVRKAFDVVRTCPWVDLLTYEGLFLDVDLRITSDTS